MRILVIGSGGREHALVWKLAQSQRVKKIYCAPGNGGIKKLAECLPIAPEDIPGLQHFATKKNIDLTIVGPEVPLLKGIVDSFNKAGLRIFGPNSNAALLEGSKSFAKSLMQKYRIPTAKYATFSDIYAAKKYIQDIDPPIVIKADGLAAGKGVIISSSIPEAEQTLTALMKDKCFGDAGSQVVIEEFLQGEEVSVMAFIDGTTYKTMTMAQDHKRAYDGDNGPNTGGMGAYAPVLQYETLLGQVEQQIFTPFMKAMKEEKIDYRGVLFAGLMITKAGPKVIEFNARFGDPETQVVLPLLENDLLEVIEAVLEKRLAEVKLHWKNKSALCVIMAAGGYPGSYQTGDVISGLLSVQPDTLVFHAGTKFENDQTLTAGGRVLGITGFGDNLMGAKDQAYATINKISFRDAHYRRDIAEKAFKQMHIHKKKA